MSYFIPICLTDWEPNMATMSIKQLKERGKGLWRLSQPKDCCGRPRIEIDYDAARDEVFGTCINCGREVFRFTSAQIVAQSPESARSDKERSLVRRSQLVVQAEQRKLGVVPDGIDGPQTQRAVTVKECSSESEARYEYNKIIDSKRAKGYRETAR